MNEDPSRFVRQTLTTFGAAVALIMVVTFGADPYGIYRKIPLTPHARTEPIVWSRVSAGERVDRDCQVVLMGSSRVVHGFGAKVPKWGGKTVCNAGVGGTSLVEQRMIFDRVLEQPRVRHVLFFLDFHIFFEQRGENGDFRQSRFNEDRSRLTYHAWALTSFAAFRDGMHVLGLPLPYFDEQPIPNSQIRANRIELYRFFKNRRLFTGWTGDEGVMDMLEGMLDDAAKRRIRVMLVIPPVHAMLMETEHLTGVWPWTKRWRERLVEMVADRRQPVDLWDFNTYHKPAMTPMPLQPGDALNPWWVDISHQSGQLAWMTMSRVIEPDAEGAGHAWDEDFGVRLTRENLAAHLEALDAGRAKWQQAEPEQLAWMMQVASELEALPDADYAPENDAAAPGAFQPVLPGDETP